MSLRIVLFDVNNVLLTSYSLLSLYKSIQSPLGFEEFHRIMTDKHFSETKSLMHMENDEFVKLLRDKTISSLKDKELLSAYVKCMGNVNFEAIRIITNCHRSRISVGVVGNVDSVIARELTCHTRDTLIDYFFLSCDLGCLKPSETMFSRVESVTGWKDEEIMYFDSDDESLMSGAKRGWKTHWASADEHSNMLLYLDNEFRTTWQDMLKRSKHGNK